MYEDRIHNYDQKIHAPGRRKKIRRNLQGKFVSAPPAQQVHPQAEQESILKTFFARLGDLEVHLVVLDPSFEGND